MKLNTNNINYYGDINCKIKFKDGKEINKYIHNDLLKTGRIALINSLSGNYGNEYNYNITNMIFGNGGTSTEGKIKIVNSERNNLFGTMVASKPVVVPTSTTSGYYVLTFISVLDYDDANGYALNEMALKMANGDLFAMATFGDLSKSSNMQLTWSWSLSFV